MLKLKRMLKVELVEFDLCRLMYDVQFQCHVAPDLPQVAAIGLRPEAHPSQ